MPQKRIEKQPPVIKVGEKSHNDHPENPLKARQRVFVAVTKTRLLGCELRTLLCQLPDSSAAGKGAARPNSFKFNVLFEGDLTRFPCACLFCSLRLPPPAFLNPALWVYEQAASRATTRHPNRKDSTYACSKTRLILPVYAAAATQSESERDEKSEMEVISQMITGPCGEGWITWRIRSTWLRRMGQTAMVVKTAWRKVSPLVALY